MRFLVQNISVLGLELILIVLQFRRKGLREDDKLSEVDFAEMLLAYAGYPAKRKTRMIKRVRKGYGGNFFSTWRSLQMSLLLA